MRKLRLKIASLVIFSFLLNSTPSFVSGESILTKNSWQENVFFTDQKFQWQYQDVSFNGAIDVVCPCENDITTITIKRDLAELNLVTEDFNDLSGFFDHIIESQNNTFVVENSTLLLNLEGIPFIYPVVKEYSNGTRINWLEQLATNNPITNYTEDLYVTRKIENGFYIQRKVFSFNPWFRFETKIDINSGVMYSLWFEEGFFSLGAGSFSHIYNLNLITDLPGTPDQLENSKNDNANYNTISIFFGLFVFIPIVHTKFLKNRKSFD